MRRAARKRTTRQLAQVLKALQGDHTHPFAHEVYQRVHKKLPRISLATVYRNLHSLVDEGKIRTLLLDRPVSAPSSTGRSEFPREARLRRHDAHLDGPWDVSGLCRSTDLEIPAPGAKTSQRPMCTTAVGCLTTNGVAVADTGKRMV
ncbi:MAG: hypothetical protein DMD75_20975 [Candidatus Rokuibacteriota bacterium]|nr:MAG: hypothetical protein DMD75_20975 [Candidatus Rokubacteria bacterium]